MKSHQNLDRVIPSLLLIALLFSATLSHSNNEEEIVIKEFDGGTFKLNLLLLNNLLYSPTVKAGSMGGTYSNLWKHSSSLYFNPAGVAMCDKPIFNIESSPLPLKVDMGFLGKYVDVQKELDDSLDSALEEYVKEGVDPVAPEVDLSIGQLRGVNSFSFATPLNEKLFLGAALHRPLKLELSLLSSGLDSLIHFESDVGEVNLRAKVEVSARAKLSLNYHTISSAWKITPNWSVGFGVEKGIARGKVVGEAKVNATLALSDGVPHQVNLPQSINGEYEGTYYKVKVGGVHHLLNHKVGLDYFLSYPTELQLEGSLETSLSKLKHLTEEGISLEGKSLTVENITTVENEVKREDTPLTIRFPPSLNFGASIKAGFLGLSINYAQYLKPLSVTIDEDSQEVNLINSAHLGLDLSYFKMGGGVIFSEVEDKKVPIPSFSFGLSLPIGGIKVDTLLVALPTPLGGISLEYKF